jgi:hypothetical protein
MPKSKLSETSTRDFWSLYFQVDFLASWRFGKLTFGQVDSLEVDYFS